MSGSMVVPCAGPPAPLRERTNRDGGLRCAPKLPSASFAEMIEDLETAVAARFRAVNGDHPMTEADDAYVSRWYAPLERLAADAELEGDELRRLMLSNRLPLPSYIRSDGTQMVAPDLLRLAQRAGGFDALPGWFAAQFDDPVAAVAEWDAYLSG